MYTIAKKYDNNEENIYEINTQYTKKLELFRKKLSC